MEIILFIAIGLFIGALIAYLVTKSGLNTLHQRELLIKADENNILIRQNSVLEAKVEAQANSLNEVRKAMVDTFKSAASDALTQNNKQFLDLANLSSRLMLRRLKVILMSVNLPSLKCLNR